MAEDIVFDWDAFEADHNMGKPAHNHLPSNVRVGFFERSFLYTRSRSIAIYQDVERDVFRFCLKKGHCLCDTYDSMLPVFIIIPLNENIAKEIIPIRSTKIYNTDDSIKKDGVEVVIHPIGEYSARVYLDGHQQLISDNESRLLIWYYLYNEYSLENKKAIFTKPFLTPSDCRTKYREIERRVLRLSLDEVMIKLLINDALQYLEEGKRKDIEEHIHSLSKDNVSSDLIDLYIKSFIDLELTAIYRDASQIQEFKRQLAQLNKDESETVINAKKKQLLDTFSRNLYAEYLFFEYVSGISGPVFHSVHKIETRLKMLERETTYWVFWRIKRSVLFSNYWDNFDKTHQRSDVDEKDLFEANQLLSQKTHTIKDVYELETFDGIPLVDFL